jgi:ATP-binding cassette subfamily B protein
MHHVLAIAAVAIVPAFAAQPLLTERDLRVRTHAAGLMRFYLDAILGLMPIRAHSAQNAVRREHERLLGEWAAASVRLQKSVVALEAVELISIYSLIATLFLSHPLHGSDIGRILLIGFWALNLPSLGQEIGALLRQYPAYRNLTLRLVEPLGAPEEHPLRDAAHRCALSHAPSIEFRNVTVSVSGHAILEDVSLRIERGSHVAIVGPSGAGKSSLLGVLLGWLKPSSGELLIDNAEINPQTLRQSTAWVDPAVQVWNRSLLANLSYGSSSATENVAQAIHQAMLRPVIETLPEGLQTDLGENGGLVSGGEGQRVRLARAFLRRKSPLVILDEPFRGLDAPKRSELLRRAREHWSDCTLLCVTHDIAETQNFDRVLVIEAGRVVEDGCPRELSGDPNTRYAQLLAAEYSNRTALWGADLWRRVRLHAGRIVEDLPARSKPATEDQAEVA